MSLIDKVRRNQVVVKKKARKKLEAKESLPSPAPAELPAPPSVIQIIDDVLDGDKEVYNFFRPSMFHGCSRANVFHYLNSPKNPQRISNQLRRILDNGSAVHGWVQDKYLSRHPRYWFVCEPKVMVKINGALVRGSCDGILIRRSDFYRFGIEFKTISHDQFLKLTKPKPEHVIQARIYMMLQKLPFIVIVYWDKNSQHLKEFVVKADEKAWKEIKRRVKRLKAFADAFAEKKEPTKLPVFNKKTCDPVFCSHTDYCRRMGAPV